MGKTEFPIICRSLILKILEAVPRATNSQPVMRTTAMRWTFATERYLNRRRIARYLSRAITVKVHKDTVPRNVVIKLIVTVVTTQHLLLQ